MRFPRTMAAAIGLVFVLGLVITPPATAQAAPGTRTVIVIPPHRVPPGSLFFPPKIGSGDADYKGHGPRVTATAFLNNGAGNKSLNVVLCMNARETQADFTEAGGCSPAHLIFLAPNGECVLSTDVPRVDQVTYVDTDHANDVFSGTPGTFVSVWNFVGDTSGNEAGTRTGVSIGTSFVTVTTVPC